MFHNINSITDDDNDDNNNNKKLTPCGTDDRLLRAKFFQGESHVTQKLGQT